MDPHNVPMSLDMTLFRAINLPTTFLNFLGVSDQLGVTYKYMEILL